MSITIKSKIMNTLPSFIFHADDNDDRNMPNNLVTVVINGVKTLPRALFDKQQSLKKLSLNNIEDMFLLDPESQIIESSSKPFNCSKVLLSKCSERIPISFRNRIKFSKDVLLTYSKIFPSKLSSRKIDTVDNKFGGIYVKLLYESIKFTKKSVNLSKVCRSSFSSSNILEYVNSTSFENLIRLRKLIGIRSLHFDSNTFEHLNGLDELSIVFDSTNFDENIFNHLNLNTLDIEFKLIQQIPTNIFRFGVDTLLHLRIDAPNVEILHEDTFSGLTILRSITINSKIACSSM
jgi:hypothetical protein